MSVQKAKNRGDRTYLVFWLGALIVFVFDFVSYGSKVVPLTLDPQIMYYTLLTFSLALFLAGVVEWRFTSVESKIDGLLTKSNIQSSSETSNAPTQPIHSTRVVIPDTVWLIIRSLLIAVSFAVVALVAWAYIVIPTFVSLQPNVTENSALSFLDSLIVMDGVLVGFVGVIASNNLNVIHSIKMSIQPKFSWRANFEKVVARVTLVVLDILTIAVALKSIIVSLVQITNVGTSALSNGGKGVSSVVFLSPLGWSVIVIIFMVTRIAVDLLA